MKVSVATALRALQGSAFQEAALTTQGASLVIALGFQGRKRTHSADEIMAEIAPPKRLVEHMERAGFVVIRPQAMKPPPEVRATGPRLFRRASGVSEPSHPPRGSWSASQRLRLIA